MIKIQPVKFIKSLYYANRPFEAKAKKVMVDLPITMEDHIYNNIAKNYESMAFIASNMKIPFRFAQKGNTILANFGPKTKVFQTSASEKEVENIIRNLAEETSALRK